jgi:hypothetical protein
VHFCRARKPPAFALLSVYERARPPAAKPRSSSIIRPSFAYVTGKTLESRLVYAWQLKVAVAGGLHGRTQQRSAERATCATSTQRQPVLIEPSRQRPVRGLRRAISAPPGGRPRSKPRRRGVSSCPAPQSVHRRVAGLSARSRAWSRSSSDAPCGASSQSGACSTPAGRAATVAQLLQHRPVRCERGRGGHSQARPHPGPRRADRSLRFDLIPPPTSPRLAASAVRNPATASTPPAGHPPPRRAPGHRPPSLPGTGGRPPTRPRPSCRFSRGVGDPARAAAP